MRLSIALCITCLATAGLRAQTPQPPTPCAAPAERHQFDFWIGDWEVRNPAGAVAGKSSVYVISGGCALLENWTGAGGGQGKSINTYNPAIKQWQQYWIGQDGNPVEFRESTYDGKSIAFIARRPSAVSRLTFTPMPDGTVRQHAETSTDDGKTWKTQYDFSYHRVVK
jgi:hypothetical protein